MWGIYVTGYRGLNTRIAIGAGGCVDWAKKGGFTGRTQHWDGAGEWKWRQPDREAEVSAMGMMVAPRRCLCRGDRVQRQVSTGSWGSWGPPRPRLPRLGAQCRPQRRFWLSRRGDRRERDGRTPRIGVSVRRTSDCGRWESAASGCGVDGAGCGSGLGGALDWIGYVTGPSARCDGHLGGGSVPFFTWGEVLISWRAAKAALAAGRGAHILGIAG
jgi:hypothetical protein